MPKYCDFECSSIVTISECFSDIHPCLTKCYYINHDKDQIDYQEKLKLDDDAFNKLKIKVSELINNSNLYYDSHFSTKEDALQIRNTFFSAISELKLVGISIEEKLVDTLADELHSADNETDRYWSKKMLQSGGVFLGYDILGFDHSSFHTYLCNGLDKDISKHYNISINKYGLIENSYSEVVDFAKIIEGKGEYVLWIPFAVHLYR